MAQIITFSRNLTFDLVLDEMPIYRDGVFRGGTISGKAEVTCDLHRQEWWISDIVVNMDNASCGSNARARAVSLNGEAKPHLYQHLLDRITADYSDNIEETIALELAEAA